MIAAHIVYALCALTSLSCMGLLLRAYRRTRMQLLFWSGLAFLAFVLANLMLFLDLVMFPAQDLSLIRSVPTLAGVILMLYGLIRSHTEL
jgi:Family of unknown function (DUF5985)